jgi:mRNA interferase MazF
MSFTSGEILLVPVAFSDGRGSKKRPVVVIFDSGDADLLVAPVTSQMSRSARDVQVNNWERAGLRLPSIVRLEKSATVEKSTVVRRMGKLGTEEWDKLKAVLRQFFGDILAG